MKGICPLEPEDEVLVLPLMDESLKGIEPVSGEVVVLPNMIGTCPVPVPVDARMLGVKLVSPGTEPVGFPVAMDDMSTPVGFDDIPGPCVVEGFLHLQNFLGGLGGVGSYGGTEGSVGGVTTVGMGTGSSVR